MARDYKAEYQRRIERGLARGLSRSQARGHPTADEELVQPSEREGTKDLEAAIRAMNHGSSMTAAARSHHVSVERLRRHIVRENLGERQGRRWVISDGRARRMPVISGGRVNEPIIYGFGQASKIARHLNAVKQFLRTNDLSYLEPFVSDSIFSTSGKEYPLETDPNALHRIASMDIPPFEEIYAITAAD